jgi:hypothetical protein
LYLSASSSPSVIFEVKTKKNWSLYGDPLEQVPIFLTNSMKEQVARNKSSLILHNILQNTQTLKLFTMIIKTESTYKIIKNVKVEGLGEET